jgi:hypothetical protein
MGRERDSVDIPGELNSPDLMHKGIRRGLGGGGGGGGSYHNEGARVR